MAPRKLVSRSPRALSETIFPHEKRKKKINGQISNQFFDTIGHFGQLMPARHPQFSRTRFPIKSSPPKKSVQG
jgi:hypothetical protein